MLTQERGRPLCMLRAMSSGLAMVFSKLGLMSFLEMCVLSTSLLVATVCHCALHYKLLTNNNNNNK